MLASLVRGVLLASPCSMTSFIVGLRPRLAGTIATARDVLSYRGGKDKIWTFLGGCTAPVVVVCWHSDRSHFDGTDNPRVASEGFSTEFPIVFSVSTGFERDLASSANLLQDSMRQIN